MGKSINKGNKNAEKWTVIKARNLAKKALNVVDEDCYFLSSIADKCGVYRELFAYLMRKFSDDETVFLTLKRMVNRCEMFIFEKSAMGEMDKTIGLFALKSLHGLYEKSHVVTDVTIEEEKKEVDYSTLTKKELKDFIKLQSKLDK